MAATTYQILYRGTNNNINVLLRNAQGEDMKQFIDLYHDDHKINSSVPEEKSAAIIERDNLLINGNTTECPKFQGLYEYTGARRFSKKKWVAETDGYLVRDWSGLDASKITNTNFGSEDGDYSGDYLIFEGDNINNGIVVAKKNLFEKEYGATGFRILDNSAATSTGGVYFADIVEGGIVTKTALDQVKEVLINSTILEIDFEGKNFGIEASKVVGATKADPEFFVIDIIKDDEKKKDACVANISIKIGADHTLSTIGVQKNTGEIGADGKPKYKKKDYNNAIKINEWNNELGKGHMYCSYVQLMPKHMKKYKIPAHWEEVTDAPYCVYDTYAQLPQEPWFNYCITHSLNEALDKCRNLVDKIGIENVRLIKVVPTDQFLRIR